MDGVLIKYVALFIVLSLPAVAAGQVDENTIISRNISVIVTDMSGKPVGDALIKATDSSGISILKLTDSNGRADLEITKKSNLIIKAEGYQDWASREPISPDIMMLAMVNEPVNTNFHIIDTDNNDVSGAFIIIEDSMGNQIVKRSDAKGSASAQVSPGMANITIKAEGHNDLTNSTVLSGNSTYPFVLKHSISPRISLFYLFALVVPFIMLLIVSLFKDSRTDDNHWYAYASAFGWILSFAVLIIIAVITNDYTIYFLDPRLKVSLFVPIAAFLGATSYITMSKLGNLERKTSMRDWKYIYVAYGRRLLMAPYIAIIALFTILEVAQLENPWAALFFAYFVGLYTKQIEGTLEGIGMKFLTEKQKTELKERDLKALETVKRLGVSTGIAEKLIATGIKDVSDLVAIQDAKIKETADKAGIDESYLRGLRDRANEQVKNIEAMGKELDIDHDMLGMLVDAGIYSKDDLVQIGSRCSREIAANCSISEERIKELIEKAKEPGK